MSEYPVQEIVKALATYLKSAVPSLQQVFDEWPTPGQVLKMPCASILTTKSRIIQEFSPTPVSQGDTTYHKADVLYQVGSWEQSLSVQIWTSNKTDRAKYLHEVNDALSPNFASGQMGLNLTLADYHSQVASYLVSGFDMPQSEEQAQRREWRAILTLDVICNAVRESRQAIIENIEMTVDPTTETIQE
jgi:hypothetical protein